MTPFQKAVELYRRYMPSESFKDDRELFLRNGYVISTPECFVMAHQIDDTWHVFLCVGHLVKCLSFVPYPLTWIEFRRNNGRTKRYKYETFLRRARAKV